MIEAQPACEMPCVLTSKQLGWYLNFSTWFMKNAFEQKKDKIMK
jgi:hypothetical protein